MAKTSSYDIEPLDFDADWGANKQDGLPQSGQQVNEFINDSFRDVARACWFDPSSYALLFFRSDADKQAYIENPSGSESLVAYRQILSFTGTVRRVNIINGTGTTTVNATTNMDNVPLTFGYQLVEKGITESEWRVLEDSATVTVYADSGDGYQEIARYTGVEHADPDIVLNVRQYLASGLNKIKVTAVANDDEQTSGSLVYSVILTEMYVENFPGRSYWYRAVVEGMSQNLYQLGGFRIVGALNKTLHMDIYAADDMDTKLLALDKVIGNTQYVNYEYSYNYGAGLRLNTLETGSYVAKVYLTSGTLSTEEYAIDYPFMYVRQADALTAQLVAIANVAKVVYNGESNVLCEFAAYNAGTSSAAPHREVQQYKGSQAYGTPIEYDSVIDTSTIYQLECPVEIEDETTELGYLRTEISVSLGECEVMAVNIVDNTASYPAVSGYDFLMNPSLRSNGEQHPEYIINNADGSICQSVIWTRMVFIDGIDGWTTDDEGRTCLKIPAGSKMALPYTFFKFLNNSNSGKNTVEICYKVGYASDNTENCITIATNPTSEGFSGLKIMPESILAHSSTDTSAAEDTNRGTKLSSGQTVDFMLSIEPVFVTGKNKATGYIDGCRNFEFAYTGNWNFNANIVIGSNTADVYIYAIRHYANSLRQDSAEANYVSTLKDRTIKIREHERIESVIDMSHDIQLNKVKNSGYNYFVVEMKNGALIPSKKNGWGKETQGQSTLEMHFGEHPSWDFRVEDVETAGQGTTSMNYWLWNLRFRLDKWPDGIAIPPRYQDSAGKYNKKRPVSYLNESGEWSTPADSKTLWFDGGNVEGETQHPALKRITAKINFASSMQSHKMGATWAYNELHSAVDNGALMNEAQIAAQQDGTPVPSVAVYEYPAFGFSKEGDTYTFIGLFTIGPDKGDKPTFGYDQFEEELITLEGTDHTPRLALFNHPWDDDVEYRASNECINIVKGSSDQDLEGGWEVSNAGGMSTDDEGDQQSIDTMLTEEFRPAYESAYSNSTLIFPVALSDDTWGGATAEEVLANINADIHSEQGTFLSSHYNNVRFPNSAMEFWIENEYVLYHYSPKTGSYVAGTNLVTQCGTPAGITLDAKNEYFKSFRRNAFKSVAADYWDLDDCIFCLCFLLLSGATDNFAKNSYPYKFRSLENGGRWRWRQDDLDTIFDIDNNGGQTKPYWIEYADTSDAGEIFFAGSSSVFWNLIYECYFEDYTDGGRTKKGIRSYGAAIMTAMQTLTSQSNVYAGAMEYIKRVFWDKAQGYFPVSAYNEDAEIKYEDAWINENNPSVPPLRQSLGNHYSAEQLWVKMRVIYMMSMFRVGPFAQYTDTTLGAISFRPVSIPALTVTSAIWMYPAVLVGQGGRLDTERLEPGETKTFTGITGDGQTVYVLQATDWLSDLGDLCKLVLGSQDAGVLNIGGDRLKTLKIGDAVAGNVTTNVTTLNLTNTPSLEYIDARNTGLANVLDISGCPRIKSVLAENTMLSSVRLMTGSKIETLHLPSTVSELVLHKTNLLSDLTVAAWANIVTLDMEDCNAISTMSALTNCYNAAGSLLEYIRLKWNTVDTIISKDLKMLAGIAQGKSAAGTTVDYEAEMEGVMKLDQGYYAADLEALQFTEITPSSMSGYKEGLSTIFEHPLRLFYKDKVYMPFRDANVLAILLQHWGDGVGVTEAQVRAITSIGTYFSYKTSLRYFDEFQYFTGVTEIGTNAFIDCKFTSITLPPSIRTLAYQAVKSSATIPDLYLPNLTSTREMAFGNTNIKKISSLGSVTSLPHYTGGGFNGGYFGGKNQLESVVLPSTLASLSKYLFYHCYALSDLVCLMPAPVTIGSDAFNGCSSLRIIYVPDESVELYQQASGWSAYTIKGVSERPTA